MILNILLMVGLGMWEIIGIIAVALLLFGGKKIPELAKGIGKGLKEFRNANKEDDSSKGNDDEDGNSPE